MKKWLVPGVGVLAAVAALAVAVVVVASPFESDDKSATAADTTAETAGDAARCASDSPDCVDPNSVTDGEIAAVCAADAEAEDCADTPGGDGGGDPMNMCIAGAEDCADTVSYNPDADDSDAVASNAAVLALSERLGIDAEVIAIVSNEPTEWPDACLGVQQPQTLCAQVITPGYKVVLMANGTQYEYHSDLSGTAIAAN